MAQATARIKLTVEQREALRKLEQVKDRISGLARTVGLLGGAFGAVGIGAFVSKAVMTAARTRELGIVLRTVGQAAGYSAEYLDELERTVIDVGIQTQVARQVLLRMIQTNIDLSKAVDLARASQAAAVIAGEDTSEALEAIIHGIVTLQPEVLRTHGIFVNLEQEYRKFAEQAGRTVESLTMQEKQQIAINAAIRSSTKIMGAYGAAMREAGKQFRTWRGRELKNMLEALGEIGMPAFEALVEWLREITTQVTEWAKANQQVLKQKVKEWVEGVTGALQRMVPWLEKHKGLLKDIALIIGGIWAGGKLIAVGKGLFGIGKALASIAAAHPMAAAIVGVIAAIAAVILKVRDLNRKVEEQREREVQSLVDLTKRYGELKKELEPTLEQKAELLTIIEKLAAQVPSVADALERAAEAGQQVLETTVEWVSQEDVMRAALDLERARIKLAELEEQNRRLQERGEAPPRALLTEIATTRQLVTELENELDVRRNMLEFQQWMASLKETEDRPEPPPGPTDEEIAAMKAAYEALHNLRIKLIADEAEREQEAAYKAFKDAEKKITAAQALGAEERYALLMEANSIYMEKLHRIQMEQEEKQRKAEEERLEAERELARERVSILMDELEYKARLYAWDKEQFIDALNSAIQEAEEGSEYQKQLMDELEQLRREKILEEAEERRRAQEEQLAFIDELRLHFSNLFADVVMGVRTSREAFRSLGSYLLSYFVKKVLAAISDAIWDAVAAARALKAAFGLLGFFSAGAGGAGLQILEGGTAPPVYVQHGALIRKPTLVLAGEAGEARQGEVISPVPMLRRIIREELSGASAAQININLSVNAIDSADAEAWIKGRGGEIIKRAVLDGWLRLQGA